MFERYTEHARRALFFARYEATQLGSPAIETEHLLLGLLREGHGVTREILQGRRRSLESVREDILRRLVTQDNAAPGHEIPFTAETKRALTHAADEADRLGHADIGTEHLLLGLLREDGADPSSVTAAVLDELGLHVPVVRNMVRGARLESEPDAAQIPRSTAVRVSVSTRGSGTSADRGLDHWILEGFPLREMLSQVYDVPTTRITLPSALDRATRYDVFLLLPREGREPQEIDGQLSSLMRVGLERQFGFTASLVDEISDVFVLTAPSGTMRAELESADDIGGFTVFTGDVTEHVLECDEPLPAEREPTPEEFERIRQRFQERMHAFTSGQGGVPIQSIESIAGSFTPAHLCDMLELHLGRCVIDETNLRGTYRVDIRGNEGERLIDLLRDQLGLVLTPDRRPVQILKCVQTS